MAQYGERLLRKARTSLRFGNKGRVDSVARRRITLANRSYSKIFGIGQNKTGTTSLEAILRAYGLRMPRQHEQETLIVKQSLLGNYEPLKRLVENYDAFQDLPFSEDHCYVACDALFPNSKFILTIRDEEDWFNSLMGSAMRALGVDDLNVLKDKIFDPNSIYLYDGYQQFILENQLTTVENGKLSIRLDLLCDKDFHTKRYIDRNNRIIKYFKDRSEDFLIIDVSKEINTEKICALLNIPQKYVIDTPHLNKTSP